jgi:hypothetical protein
VILTPNWRGGPAGFVVKWCPMRSLLLASSLTALVACDGIGQCTQVGCEHEATVSFPAGIVAGPFDLHVDDGLQMLAARCNDPEAEETADNPPELSCDSSGFRLTGHPLANARSVRVTVVDVETGDAPIANAEVFLDVVNTLHPNGEDCGPTCYVRNGQVHTTGVD